MNGFIKYLENKNFSKRTQQTYLTYTNLFLHWYTGKPINCTKKDILKYLEYLKNQKGQSNRTRSITLNSLNHYFNYLTEHEQITSNPTTLLKIRGTKKKILYNIYTIEELTQLHDDYYHTFIRNSDSSRIPLSTREQTILARQRNYTILGLLFYQGLNTNEIDKITLDDIDLNKATIQIQGSRRSNERKMLLQASQIGSLMNYINNIRPQLLEFNNTCNNALFFPLHESDTSSRSCWCNLFLHLKSQVKTLDTNFTNFKQIRASVITHWIKTQALRKAQYLAGHRYISSTEYYLPNDLENLTDDITKYNPF